MAFFTIQFAYLVSKGSCLCKQCVWASWPHAKYFGIKMCTYWAEL